MVDPNFYLGLATEITGKVRRLASFTGHAPSIGLHHEEIVREAMRPLMSRRFSLRTGFTFLDGSTTSSQGDILVVDESDPAPYFFQMGDLVVVHPRALACVVEVKTQLSKSTFLQAMCNQYSFKRVAAAASPGRNLPTLVFAFDSAAFASDTLHQWYAAVDVPNEVANYPHVVYSLKRGALLLRPQRGNAPFGHYAVLGEESEELNPKALSLFLQTFRKILEKKAGLESNPFEYSDLQGLLSSEQCVQFRQGLVSSAKTNSPI
jgi:hypothetical protein